MKDSFKEVKEKSIKGRYFSYEHWWDRLFTPLAIYVTWACIRMGVSGNAVSWISAFIAVSGAFLLTSDDRLLVFIGSFGYILWFLLDYVDGAVARYNSKGGISGQYVDWIMHVISHVAIVAGISIGATSSAGPWIYPFIILGVIASCLAYSKFSMAWFAICMEQQQRRAKGLDIFVDNKLTKPKVIKSSIFKYIRIFTILCFHENYLIFTLPIIAGLQLIQVFDPIDMRVVFTVFAGLLYFPVQVLEIHQLVSQKRIEQGYSELFSPNHVPDLPNDHFFK